MNKLWFKEFRTKSAAILQKFGRGLMLPIAILPFAGLLLGIGGAIGANVAKADVAAQTTAQVFKSMSEIVFANLPVLFCIAVVITFTNEAGSAAFIGLLGFLVFQSSQMPFIHFMAGKDAAGKEIQIFHDIMWFHKSASLGSITTLNLGISSLQTSIFGGVLIGALCAWIYNRFHLIKLPNAISFFSGVRFLPIIVIPACFLTAIVFCVFWPWIGVAINLAGEAMSKTPYGVDGLIYGIFTRALMPFGLHHIVIAVAYQTPFGGILNEDIVRKAATAAQVSNSSEIAQIINILHPSGKEPIIKTGDQSIWNFINGLNFNTLPTLHGNMPIFQWFSKYAHINAGRFTHDYPTYLGVTAGIGLAIIFTADKENRKSVISVIGSAIIVAFLTGITEPLEFTFLFIAPWLYYAIYVPLSGISYMLMTLVGAHVGVGFARGFIDLIIYGAVPVIKGTRFYYAFVFGLAEGLVALASFWFLIKKFNIATPGRNGNEIKLLLKKDFLKAKQKSNSPQSDQRILAIIEALGGKENITFITACATRLRATVVDESKINKDLFIEQGAAGSIIKGNNIQVVFGGEATIISQKISNIINY